MDKNQNQKKVFKSYQDELTIQDRKQKYGQLIEKYPNQFPVILQCQEPQLREKFLYQKYTVNKTVVLKDFFLQIQKKISDNNLGNIYFYDEKNQLISYLLDKKIEEIEPELRNKEDGFIYLYYTDKNPFWSFDYRSNKDQYTLEQRKNQYKDLNVKKDQVAITVEPHPESAIGKQFKEIDKKLMLSQNCTIKDLKNELLKSFWQEFKPEQLNIFVSKIVLVTDENKNVGELNQKYKDEDGFLYLLLCEFNPYTTKFKQAYTLEERKLRCQMAQKNFPDLLPVVIEPSKPNQKTIFSQKFFMLKKNMSIIELSTSLKQKFKINQSQALFLFIGKRSLIDLKKDLNQISNEFRDAEDQILYIQYCDYDVFG